MASLSSELTKLRRLLLTMSAEVEQRVDHCFQGLLRHDLRLAERVRDTDDAVDQLDVDIESECTTILALHHPLAGDLRYVLAALRINSDLERIADLARGIAKKTIKIEFLRPVEVPPILGEMCRSIRGLLADALQSLTDLDPVAARSVRSRDKQVDRQFKELLTWAVRSTTSEGDTPRAMLEIVAVVRSMERMGDLAVSIAESVIYAAEGSIVRHARVEPQASR